MNWKQVRKVNLQSILATLEEAFHALNIDFYLVGALAKDYWYSSKGLRMRQTKDVDFAVLVPNANVYMALKEYLANKEFVDIKEDDFVMISPGGVRVDILPFGAMEIDGSVMITSEGMTSISVNGLREVYQAGTEDVDMQTGRVFKAATLAAIVLLKLIAYNDRPEYRIKDAGDIAGILMNYFELQLNLIYEKHNDLFDGDTDRELEEIAAIVIGREMKKICGENIQLCERLQRIIKNEIDENDESRFLRRMATETGKTVEEMSILMNKMLEGTF